MKSFGQSWMLIKASNFASQDIERQIRNLVTDYVSKPNSYDLLVPLSLSPAS
jgi:hypothetical protein